MTRQLLAFSRKQVVQPKSVDLNKIIYESSEMLIPLIGKHILLIMQQVPGECLIKVDPNQITQLLLNLCVNARDAMPDGGTLVISTSLVEFAELDRPARDSRQPGRYVMLSISDTGSGITPEAKSRIFEPFFTTKEVGKGTGLGLSVVHGIVAQSNGWIDVQSSPDEGTTFNIYFPELKVAAPRHVPLENASAVERGHETILLVEDEESVQGLTTLVLESIGYTVVAAKNGQEALRLIDQPATALDLLITDVMMPGMTGPQLARLARLKRPELKILFVSGYTPDPELLDDIRDGRSSFLQKPYSRQELAAKVKELAAMRRG